MNQLEKLKLILSLTEQANDSLLQFYLDCAKDIICEIRYSTYVEDMYLNLQLMIAVELFSKRGAEGQVAHAENGIIRTYDKSDVSDSLLAKITPRIKTPYSTAKVVVTP